MKRSPLNLYLLLCLPLVAVPPAVTAQTNASGALYPSMRAGFSNFVAFDGDHVLVGRSGESMMFPEPPMHTGGVHVFSQSSDGWMQTQIVEASDGHLGDLFGHRFAVAGNVMAVSAPKAEEGRGAVYVFNRMPEGGWAEAKRLSFPDAQPGDSLGWGVAVADGLVIAGAPGHDGKGAVAVYRRGSDDGSWNLAGVVESPAAPHGRFGTSVGHFAGHVVAGAPRHNDGRGAIFVFGIKGEASEWSMHHELMPADSSHMYLGSDLRMSGQKLLAGAVSDPQDRVSLNRGGPGAAATGKVFLFDHGTEGWAEVTAFAPENASGMARLFFGSSFGFGSAGSVWIGSPMDLGAGAAYVYAPSDDGWVLKQTLTPGGIAPGASFGGSLAVSEDLAVVGATRADFGDGRAFIYRDEEESGKWVPEGEVTDSGLGLVPLVGESVTCKDGKAGPFGCASVDLLSFLPNSAVGAAPGVIVNDLWGWTDPETGREYAIVGRSDGTTFIDVTDPLRPVYVGQMLATKTSVPNAWRDVKTYADHAFVVADNVGQHGMQIFDLRQLRDVTDTPATFEATALYENVYSAHNVVINEETGFAYIVAASGGGETCGGGLHMVDVNDPVNPKFAGCFHDPTTGVGGRGATHDAQCVVYRGPDRNYQGKEICFGANETALSIADVTDKKAPVALAAVPYPSVGYTHQGWLTEDHRYFFMDDEGDELFHGLDRTRTMIWDVSDLEDPILAKIYFGTTSASDHNLYIRGNMMYQSNYVAGLQVIDISDPLNPVEVGSFDTVPWGENIPGFAGSWSNYPYFKSGNVIVTSVREGMFVVKPTSAPLP